MDDRRHRCIKVEDRKIPYQDKELTLYSAFFEDGNGNQVQVNYEDNIVEPRHQFTVGYSYSAKQIEIN